MKLKGFVSDGNGGQCCPTDVCGALCCSGNDVFTNAPGKCSGLTEDMKCKFELGVHGALYKPYWCVVWPRNQEDIDKFNAKVAHTGKQCQLYFEDE